MASAVGGVAIVGVGVTCIATSVGVGGGGSGASPVSIRKSAMTIPTNSKTATSPIASQPRGSCSIVCRTRLFNAVCVRLIVEIKCPYNTTNVV